MQVVSEKRGFNCKAAKAESPCRESENCPYSAPSLKGKGAIAQLGERDNGIVEVRGSIPLGSTNFSNLFYFPEF